ncbi:MAG: sigma-70 family RNA polymerase sigma factor [Chloroflexota bacterium]|nr:sigma-70 family RNA polymerase sigma factor [Chloroflexota bacterium]
MAPSDEALLTQYRAGDVSAFRALVDRYTSPIYNLALRFLRDPMEAENVTQETFLRVVGALERVRLDMPFKPYVFQIAVNLCRDLARKNRPLTFTDLDSGADRAEGREGEAASETIADAAAPPVERLEEEELHAQLHAAIDGLPMIYQAVVTLRYVEDFSYEEIAQALDLPVNTVRTHLHRAKGRLRAHLEKELEPESSHDGVRLSNAEGGV